MKVTLPAYKPGAMVFVKDDNGSLILTTVTSCGTEDGHNWKYQLQNCSKPVNESKLIDGVTPYLKIELNV